MPKCYFESGESPPELIYDSSTDYLNREHFQTIWEKMAKNISETVKEILIQHPELIPVFEEFIVTENKLTLGDNEN